MSHEVVASNRAPGTAMAILAVTMFVTGFTGFVFECILSTVATYVLGNSVEQFSVTIGLMLACMGLGSFAQQYVRASRPVLPFVCVELLLVMVGGFAPVAMYAAFGFFEHHFQLIQYVIAGGIGFLSGVPLGSNDSVRERKNLPANWHRRRRRAIRIARLR